MIPAHRRIVVELTKVRIRKGIAVHALAAAMQVDPSVVLDMEAAGSDPTLSLVLAYAEALHEPSAFAIAPEIPYGYGPESNEGDRKYHAHFDYVFSVGTLGRDHDTTIEWLMNGYGVDARTIQRWGFRVPYRMEEKASA